MVPYIIATDSTSDLPVDYLIENEIPVLNLSYIVNEVTYGNDKQMEVKEFYDLMRDGILPKTSQINPDEAEKGLREIAKNNKNILFIAFSSGLSGTYNSMRLAADELMEEDDSLNIKVIDSLCASMGEGLLVYKAVELRKEGKSFEEVCKYVEDRKLNIVHLFTVDDLNHLYLGGRVTKGAAVIGTMLSVKPLLHVDNEGHLVPLLKLRGRNKALMSLIDDMSKKMGSFEDENDVIFISHADSLDDAKIVADEIIKSFGQKKIMINNIGPTIGAHSGPGTIAIFFLGDVR